MVTYPVATAPGSVFVDPQVDRCAHHPVAPAPGSVFVDPPCTQSLSLPALIRSHGYSGPSVPQKRRPQNINYEIDREMCNHCRFETVPAVEISKGDPGDAVEQERGGYHERRNRHEERGGGKMAESE